MSYIGKIPATGNFVKLDAISVVNGQAAYTMQSDSVNFTPESANHMLVSLNGVIQAPISSFTISGSTITFASALSTGDIIDFIMVYGNVLDIGTPSDDTISASKLQTDSVIEAKIQNDAVTRDKINAISTSSLPAFEAKGTSGDTDGYIQLNCELNTHGIKLKSPPHSAGQSYTLTFPSTAPATDKFLQTNSSGVLSFADAGGITEADAFRLTTAVNGSGLNFITSNIERIDETSFSKIGTGLTESSGVFSFASTGIYLVQASFNWYSNNNNYTRGYIYVTTDNASYDSVAQSTEYIQAGELSNGYTFAFVDVTDVSQVKVKFAFMGGDSSSGVLGDTAETETGFNFIRLGDT